MYLFLAKNPNRPKIYRQKRKYGTPEERKRYSKFAEYNKRRPVIIHDPCPHCGVVLKAKSKRALEIHIALNHTYTAPVTCDICGRPCQSITIKRNHERTHLGPDERAKLREIEPPQKWLCPECGRILSSESKFIYIIRYRDNRGCVQYFHCLFHGFSNYILHYLRVVENPLEKYAYGYREEADSLWRIQLQLLLFRQKKYGETYKRYS